MIRKILYLFWLFPLVFIAVTSHAHTFTHGGAIYYISDSEGADGNDGLSVDTPLQSITAVNALNLQPGDQVRFKCGDRWRGESLVITDSGLADARLLFGSYPAGCANKPIISGSQPIVDWVAVGGNIYRADLAAGGNNGLFDHGINQLFQQDQRLPFGRWPNLDAGDGGYTAVDSAPSSTQLVDNELPDVDWTGAVIHIKSIRWLILNRFVTGSSGNTLTLGENTECWGGCAGWGYFINNHLATLDQEGEWYYNESSNEVYLYSTNGLPADNEIEGSVVMETESNFWGGIVLGNHLQEHIDHVTIENLQIKNWYDSGISTPTNLEADDHDGLIIRNNHIKDVDSTGIRLATWVWNPDYGVAGWRGGHNLTIHDNIIEGANHFGIDSYAYASVIRDNEIRNIALIANVGQSGIGCGFSGSNCTENGAGIRLKLDNVNYSSHSNTLQYNRLERIGMQGIDVFGPHNTLEYNFIDSACYTKGDCGAIRTFGRDNLNDTEVYDLVIRNNIIFNTIGNTDGTNTPFRPLFGMGLYIDHYSKDIEVTGNTVVSSTIDGILFQNSTGSLRDNVVYNNNVGSMSRGQIGFYQPATQIAELRNNVLYGLHTTDAFNFAKTLHAESSDSSNLTFSNNNYFFNPYRPDHISVEGLKTLSEWQLYSGLDDDSHTNWFTLEPSDPPRSQLFYNDSKSTQAISLGVRRYLDVAQQDVFGTLVLDPFTSIVLIENGTVSFAEQIYLPMMVK